MRSPVACRTRQELAQLDDESLRPDLEAEISAIETELEKRAFTAMLSGKYDHDSAILAIHAGAGGTDSQDWAAMLERMYLRWAEQQGYPDRNPGYYRRRRSGHQKCNDCR